ncbi:recombinase family protein [Sedimentibacter sp. MB31-C6]|uniref:recombinase family protein n=1 Tax=Sedimentibacter sp. MB31-C6 TaxID=3109366 RepID=UPI002DDD4B99|nr:recombinase family protein [Sedimentibacter sp. MB36-C1]WSI03164.1 recombinase family protein [Sedimentibacter sp. MB36-C1]
MRRHIPIGYRMIDGKIVLDNKKAEMVKKIFKNYLNESSTHKIAQKLTAEGFLNANNKPSWNHGSVGRILENTKYLGDTIHPQIIDEKIFELVQKRRNTVATKLGRDPQLNSMRNQRIFSNKLKCGECGEVYREYIENVGKASEIRNWKCKKYIHRNKVCCRNLFLTSEEIENIFISATNKLLSRMWMLDKEKKKEPPKINMEIRNIEERVKELEEEEQYSSKELARLVFKRAQAYYNNSKADDYDCNTQKIKEELMDKKCLEEFEEELFIKIANQILIYRDGRIIVEFINGITMEEDYENIRKDE